MRSKGILETRLLAAATIGAGVLLAATTLAGATHVTPVLLPGASMDGKRCSDLQGSGQAWTDLEVDPNRDGTFSDGTLTVSITHTQADKVLSWSSNIGVDAVVVKAGQEGSYLYRYDPPAEATSDTGLTTPGSGNAISHVTFCYDREAPPSPPPPPPSPSPPAPAPPQPAPPVVDLAVTKVDSPDPVRVGRELLYTLTVSNTGPDAATNVQLSDPLDSSLVVLSASPSQGSCTTAQLVVCSLGTIPNGGSVTILLRVRATRTGSVENTATAVAAEPEANLSDNSATAVTVVVAVAKPPKKPKKPGKPVVKGAVCIDFRTVPLSVTAGRTSTVRIVVTEGGRRIKGVRVVLRGAGVSATARTGSGGVAVLRVRPTRSGFVKVTLPGRDTCRDAREIGVVAPVLLPPVTG